MEIALATRTGPGEWWDETDETLATVVELLEEQAREAKRRNGR